MGSRLRCRPFDSCGGGNEIMNLVVLEAPAQSLNESHGPLLCEELIVSLLNFLIILCAKFKITAGSELEAKSPC